MVDLSIAILIPFQTIVKTNCGVRLLFMRRDEESDIEGPYKFVLMDNVPGEDSDWGSRNKGSSVSYHVNGGYFTCSGPNDPTSIVSIGKPWHPIIGERVAVIGFGRSHHSTTGIAINLSEYPDDMIVISRISTDQSLEDKFGTLLVRWQTANGLSAEYEVAIGQLKKWKPEHRAKDYRPF